MQLNALILFFIAGIYTQLLSTTPNASGLADCTAQDQYATARESYTFAEPGLPERAGSIIEQAPPFPLLPIVAEPSRVQIAILQLRGQAYMMSYPASDELVPDSVRLAIQQLALHGRQAVQCIQYQTIDGVLFLSVQQQDVWMLRQFHMTLTLPPINPTVSVEALAMVALSTYSTMDQSEQQEPIVYVHIPGLELEIKSLGSEFFHAALDEAGAFAIPTAMNCDKWCAMKPDALIALLARFVPDTAVITDIQEHSSGWIIRTDQFGSIIAVSSDIQCDDSSRARPLMGWLADRLCPPLDRGDTRVSSIELNASAVPTILAASPVCRRNSYNP